MNSWNNAVLVNGGTPDAAGNVTRYVIHRMCTLAGKSYAYVGSGVGDPSNVCATDNPMAGSSAGNSAAVGATGFPGQALVYFRVSVRVDGPHNTVSVTQVNILYQSS
jgi:hypothetical protein